MSKAKVRRVMRTSIYYIGIISCESQYGRNIRKSFNSRMMRGHPPEKIQSTEIHNWLDKVMYEYNWILKIRGILGYTEKDFILMRSDRKKYGGGVKTLSTEIIFRDFKYLGESSSNNS